MTPLSNRKDPTELPEVEEILTLLEKEAKRSVALGKEDQHFADFQLPLQ